VNWGSGQAIAAQGAENGGIKPGEPIEEPV
jgi:hypothetical protein